MIWLPLTYLRPSTTSLCMRGCVTTDLGKRQVARSTAPLFYEQTPTCPRMQISQFASRDPTEDVRLCRRCKRTYYDCMPSDVIYYFPQLTYKARLYIPRRILSLHIFFAQIGTTKGTGGDVLILEEAAYCDEGFFYETVAPILSVGTASLVAISTLTSEINFYTRLIKMRDPSTGRPLFTTRCIELVCEKCKEDGKSEDCVSARPPRRCPSPRHSPPFRTPTHIPMHAHSRPPPVSPSPPPPPLPRSPAARPTPRTSRPGFVSAPAATPSWHACTFDAPCARLEPRATPMLILILFFSRRSTCSTSSPSGRAPSATASSRS